MGWRSWNAHQLGTNQSRIEEQIAALLRPGPEGGPSLFALGYNDVGVDDGWQLCHRYRGTWHTARGEPAVDTHKFPSLRSMVAAAHAKRVKVGWYLNNCWCNGAELAVWPRGNPNSDARLVVQSGFDSVKVDGCGPARDMAVWKRAFARAAATRQAARGAANHSGKAHPPRKARPLLIENCANNNGSDWQPAQPADVRSCTDGGFHT